jgi:NAD(P)H-dependent FMN reductase
MRDAICAGAAEVSVVETLVRPALDASPEDVLASGAILLLTPENLGYMSGALKDFFDRIYYPCLDRTSGVPYALCIRAGNDGAGAVQAVTRIVTGLRWRPFRAPLVCRGAWRPDFLDDCRELGALAAAGLDAGIF